MAVPDVFGIHERPLGGGGVRLTLVGELDLAAAPHLEQRLDQLRTQRTRVCLDLSRLEFIDSSGLRVLLMAWNNGQRDGWSFEVDPHVSNQAAQLFKLVGVERMFVSEASTGA